MSDQFGEPDETIGRAAEEVREPRPSVDEETRSSASDEAARGYGRRLRGEIDWLDVAR